MKTRRSHVDSSKRCELKTKEGKRCKNAKMEGCIECPQHGRSVLKGTYAPEKYLEGLTPKEREQRLKELQKGAKSASDDPASYKPSNFKTDFDKDGKRKPTKTSTYTKAFYDLHSDAKTLKQKAKVTGVPEDILKQVYNRGLAAWRTGHRPGATQGQWGIARVHSFLMKGCTYYFPDHLLVEEAKERSKAAEKWWKDQTCTCAKGCKIGKK